MSSIDRLLSSVVITALNSPSLSTRDKLDRVLHELIQLRSASEGECANKSPSQLPLVPIFEQPIQSAIGNETSNANLSESPPALFSTTEFDDKKSLPEVVNELENLNSQFGRLQAEFVEQSDVVENQKQLIHHLSMQLENTQIRETELNNKLDEMKTRDENQIFVINSLESSVKILQDKLNKEDELEDQKRSDVLQAHRLDLRPEEMPKFEFLEMSLNELTKAKKDLKNNNLELKIENAEVLSKMKNLEKKCKELKGEVENLAAKEKDLKEKLAQKVSETSATSRERDFSSDEDANRANQNTDTEKDHFITQMAKQIVDLKAELRNLENWKADLEQCEQTDDNLKQQSDQKSILRSFISRELFNTLEEKYSGLKMDLETLEAELEKMKLAYKEECNVNTELTSQRNAFRDNYSKLLFDSQHKNPHIQVDEFVQLKSQSVHDEAQIKDLQLKREELTEENEKKANEIEILKAKTESYKQEMKKLIPTKSNFGVASRVNPEIFAKIIEENCDKTAEVQVLKENLSILDEEIDSLKRKLEFSEEARRNLSDELKAMSMSVGGLTEQLTPEQEVDYLKEKLCLVTASNEVLEKSELKFSAQLKKIAAEKSVLESQNQKLEAKLRKQIQQSVAPSAERKKSSSFGSKTEATEQKDSVKQILIERAAQINQICKLEAENENLANRLENMENINNEHEQLLGSLTEENEQLSKDKEEILKVKVLESLDDENKTSSFVENIVHSKIKLDKADFEISNLKKRLKNSETSLTKSQKENKQQKILTDNLKKELAEILAKQAQDVGLQDIAADYASIKSKSEKLKAEVLHLESCLREGNESEEALRNEIALLKSENEVLSENLSSAITDEGQLETVYEVLHYKAEATSQKLQVEKLDSELGTLCDDNKELSNKCEALEKYCQKLSRELEKLMGSDASGASLEEREEKLKLEVALEQYDEKFRNLSDAFSTLQEVNEQLGHEKRILQESQEEMLQHVDDPVKEIIDLKQELEMANVAINACQANLRKAKESEMKMKQELETSKLLEGHPTLEESSFFQSSFSVSEVADNNEVKAEAFELRLRNKELEDQVFYLKSSKQRLEGEMEIALEKSPHSIARELIYANQEISHLEVERDSLKEQLKAIQGPTVRQPETRSTSAVAVLTPTAISRVDSRLSDAMKEVDSLKDIKKRLSEEVQELFKENNVNSLSEYPKTSEPKHADILSTLYEVESSNEVLSVHLDALQREVASYREAVALLNDEKQDLVLENSSLKTEVDRLKKQTSSKVASSADKTQASFAPPVKPIPNEEFVMTQKKLIDAEDQVTQLSNISNQLQREKKNLLARIDSLRRKNEHLHMETIELSQNTLGGEQSSSGQSREQFHRLKDLEAENSALVAQLQNCRTSEKQVRETVKSLEIDKAKLESKVGPLKRGAALKNMDPSERIKELEAVEKLLKKKNNEIEKKYDAENTKAKELELENLQYQKRQESLLESERQLVSKAGEIEKLQKDLNVSNASVTFLRQNLQELEEEATKSDKVVQEDPITVIQNDPTKTESMPTDIKSEFKDNLKNDLQEENKTLKDKIDELKKASPKIGKLESKTKSGTATPTKTTIPPTKSGIAKPKISSAFSPTGSKQKVSITKSTGDTSPQNKSAKEKTSTNSLPVERIAELEAENKMLKHKLESRPCESSVKKEEFSPEEKADAERQKKALEENLKRKVEEIKDAELKYEEEIKNLQNKLNASEKQWDCLRKSNLVSRPQLEEIEKIKEKYQIVHEDVVVPVAKEPAVQSARKMESLESSGKILKANIKGAENLLAIVNLEQKLEASENERQKLRIENEDIKEKFDQATVKIAENEATLLELSETNDKLTQVSTSNDKSLRDIYAKLQPIKSELTQCKSNMEQMTKSCEKDFKDIETRLENILNRLLEFEEDIRDKESTINSLKEDNDIINEALNELSNEFESLKYDREKISEQLEKANSEHQQLMTENKEKITELSNSKKRLEQSLENLENEILEKDAEIAEKNLEIERVVENSEKKAQDVESLNSASNKLEELLSQQKACNDEISEINKSLAENLQEIKKEKSALEKQLEKISSELETARSMREEIKEKLLENEKKVLQQKSEIDKANELKKEQLDKIESIEELLKNKSDQVDSLEELVKKLKSALRETEDEKRKLNILLQDGEDLGKRAESREKNLEKEVDNLSKELQRETDSLLNAAKELKILQDKNHKLHKDYESLKEQSKMKDEINEQLEQVQSEFRVKINELSRENKKLEHQLQNCNDEIATLKGDISDLSESEKELKEKVADLKNDNTKKQKNIDVYKDEVANLNSEIEQLSESLSNAETSRKSLERKKNELSKELEQFGRSLREGESSLRSSLLQNEINSSEVAKLKSQNTVLQQKLKDRSDDVTSKAAEIGQLDFKLQQADRKLQEHQEKLQNLKEEMQKELNDLQFDLTMKEKENEKLRGDIKDLKGYHN